MLCFSCCGSPTVGNERFRFSHVQSCFRDGITAADIMIYAMSKCQVTPFHGSWEADAWRLDMLEFGIMVLSGIPSLWKKSVQDPIDEWSGQANLHALCSAPQWLALRINRSQHYLVATRKVRARMVRSQAIAMPMFNSGQELHVDHAAYGVSRFAVHLGSDIRTGHLRALSLDRRSRRLRYSDCGLKRLVLKAFNEAAGDVCMIL